MKKLAAIMLIALGALPFTAPFATCDLSGLLADQRPLERGPAVSVASLVNESIAHVVPVARTVVRGRPLTPSGVPHSTPIISASAIARAWMGRRDQTSSPPALFAVLRI
jgi:hypothetical protein